MRRIGKAQVSIEFLFVVGIAIAVLSLVLIIIFPYFQESILELNLERAKNLVDKIEKEVNFVCALGENSSLEMYFIMPSNVLKNFTFLNNKYVYITVNYKGVPQKFSKVVECNVSGTLPLDQGEYRGFFVSKGEEVIFKLVNPVSFIKIEANKTTNLSNGEVISYNVTLLNLTEDQITSEKEIEVTFYGCGGSCVGDSFTTTISGTYSGTYTYDCSLGNYTLLTVEEKSQKVFSSLLLLANC